MNSKYCPIVNSVVTELGVLVLTGPVPRLDTSECVLNRASNPIRDASQHRLRTQKENRRKAVLFVRALGFEPRTPSVSVMCSTN